MTLPSNPQILQGDVLCFDPEPDIKSGDKVLAWMRGQPHPIFRVLTFDENVEKYQLTPINTAYRTIKTGPEKCDIIAKLIFVARHSADLL